MNTPTTQGWIRALLVPAFCLATAAALHAQIEFYTIGDLPGGGVHSEVRDAVLLPDGSIVAVGTASRFGVQGDTPIKWTLGGGIVQLANDFPGNTSPAFVTARAISADGNLIVGSARNAPSTNNRCPAIWTAGGSTLTRLGFLGGTPTFFPNVGLNSIAASAPVAYGFTRGANDTIVAFRYTSATGMQALPFLRPSDLFNFSGLRAVSSDGLTIAGNSTDTIASPNIGLQAYRYVHAVSGGTITALPAIAGGDWTVIYGMTPDGTKILGSSGAGTAVGEAVIWHSDGTLESLGTPPGIAGFSNFGGISADGETVVVSTDLGVFLHNPSGWFKLQDLLTEAGIDQSNWALLFTLGISSDARLIYGVGTRTNGEQEGFIVKLPPDFMKSFGDTTPPELSLPADLVVEATSAAGAIVNFTASATDAVDGAVPVIYSQNPGTQFPLGTTTVNVSATDASNNVATGSFTVTVSDTTAPVITSLYASPALLWPPNHKMHTIAVSGTTSDAVGPVTLRIVSITSNEPDNGLGDGDTAGDVVITGALTASLRAERAGKGTGRIYTITVEAKDAAGNASTGTVTVTVPKN